MTNLPSDRTKMHIGREAFVLRSSGSDRDAQLNPLLWACSGSGSNSWFETVVQTGSGCGCLVLGSDLKLEESIILRLFYFGSDERHGPTGRMISDQHAQPRSKYSVDSDVGVKQKPSPHAFIFL